MIGKKCSELNCITILGKQVSFRRNCSLKNEKISISNFQLNHLKLIKIISKLNENFNKREIRLAEEDMNEKVRKQWSLLSRVIDRLLLYLFMFLTFFVLGGIINQVSSFKLKFDQNLTYFDILGTKCKIHLKYLSAFSIIYCPLHFNK